MYLGVKEVHTQYFWWTAELARKARFKWEDDIKMDMKRDKIR